MRQALGSKVSRERIGTELEGMFNGAVHGHTSRKLDTIDMLMVVAVACTTHAADVSAQNSVTVF